MLLPTGHGFRHAGANLVEVVAEELGRVANVLAAAPGTQARTAQIGFASNAERSLVGCGLKLQGIGKKEDRGKKSEGK